MNNYYPQPTNFELALNGLKLNMLLDKTKNFVFSIDNQSKETKERYFRIREWCSEEEKIIMDNLINNIINEN